MNLFAVKVGYTIRRPVRPDERTTYVLTQVDGDNPVQAQLDAATWVAHRPGVVMVTSTSIEWAVL